MASFDFRFFSSFFDFGLALADGDEVDLAGELSPAVVSSAMASSIAVFTTRFRGFREPAGSLKSRSRDSRTKPRV